MRFLRFPSAFVLVAAACGDATGPEGGEGLRLLTAEQTDTALATLAQALVVEVRDSTGRPAAGITVRFDALVTDTTSYASYSLELAPLSSSEFRGFVAESTDADGRAVVLVRLGMRAGPAAALVSVPTLGYVDTAAFTVVPGAPAFVLLTPSDTALFVGGTFSLASLVMDRWGNGRPETPTSTALDPQLTVSSEGTVTAQAVGRARVAVTYGAASDTARVSVVPAGAFAASAEDGIVTVRLDGSQLQRFPLTLPYNGAYPSWMPGGSTLVVERGPYQGRLALLTLASGEFTDVVTGADSGLVDHAWPSATRDGSWIYFAGVLSGSVAIWRVTPAGAELSRIGPVAQYYEVDSYPSPSPDGTRLAIYTLRSGVDPKLATLDVGSGAITSLGVRGVSPRWAPTSDRIAYVEEDFVQTAGVWIINADGTGNTRLTPADRAYRLGLDWSPDEAWILASTPSGIDLINVATGVVLPLPFTAGWHQPAWRP